MNIARFVFRFLPKPDRVIVLHTKADIILARKEEVSREELERQLDRYREIAEDSGGRAVLVDCGGEADVVSEEVLKHILAEVKKRSR
ncbi:MAG: thymidylate kinase [Akkermansiaceae bacterium]